MNKLTESQWKTLIALFAILAFYRTPRSTVEKTSLLGACAIVSQAKQTAQNTLYYIHYK